MKVMGDKHPLTARGQPRCTGVPEPCIPAHPAPLFLMGVVTGSVQASAGSAMWRRGLVLCMGISTGSDPPCTSPGPPRQHPLWAPSFLPSQLRGPECGPPFTQPGLVSVAA